MFAFLYPFLAFDKVVYSMLELGCFFVCFLIWQSWYFYFSVRSETLWETKLNNTHMLPVG